MVRGLDHWRLPRVRNDVVMGKSRRWGGSREKKGETGKDCDVGLCGIFLDGCEPFAEDLWKQIKINESNFQRLCPLDGSEPTETMMKFQSAKALEGTGLPLADAGNGSNKVINVGNAIDVEKVFPSYADVAVTPSFNSLSLQLYIYPDMENVHTFLWSLSS
ncbi:hypothetical protein Tco_0899384 [Tanacetum coccineum]